jgi:3-oxoacyl-[acyl-carrier protein] reductase
VELFLDEGASVAFTHTAASESVDAWVAELSNQNKKVKNFVLNLNDFANFKTAVSDMTTFLGGLDGVLNNAGLARDQLMLRMKEEDFDATLDVNLKGSYFFTKECLRPLLKCESPSVVFMSSAVALMGNAGQTAYSASKAGLIGLAKSMAREMASRQLRVNVVAPGFIETDMTAAIDEAAQKAFFAQIPLGRVGKASEIAYGAAYLLSDMSRYVTGQVLNINGGLYI